MNEVSESKVVDSDIDEDLDDEVETDEDAVADVGEDEGIEMTGEVNVDALVAKLDAAPKDDVERKKEIRQRLETLQEEHEKDLDSTYNFNLDDDL